MTQNGFWKFDNFRPIFSHFRGRCLPLRAKLGRSTKIYSFLFLFLVFTKTNKKNCLSVQKSVRILGHKMTIKLHSFRRFISTLN
jgi:hypothetical protein